MDPTEPIRQQAGRYPDVEEGLSCNQTSYKIGKTAFLYIGEQGGRYKAMFKLQESLSEAEELAVQEPENYQVGSTRWVTARFSDDEPMPRELWERWLEESYQLSLASGTKKKTSKKKATKKKNG